MGVKDDNHPLFQREKQIREDQHILFCYVSGSVPKRKISVGAEPFLCL